MGGTDTREHQVNAVDGSCFQVSECVDDSDALLRRFWETETFDSDDISQSPDEQQAFDHFATTHSRNEDGRYEVCLPRCHGVPALGASRQTALRRYLNTEKSLTKQGKWEAYRDQVSDYIRLGHAEFVPSQELSKPHCNIFYLPMHGVSKLSSTTTKVRPVCDASSKSSSGVSLNDTLLPGPFLYPKINKIVNRFRRHRIAMTGDVSKMHLQISLSPTERDYHRFLHRGESGEISDCRMTRLTFGVTSSPFLATQVLRQVALDHQSDHPEAANIVNNSFYVDDVLTGADSLQQAQHLRTELNLLLSKACMPLCKWRSNSLSLIQSIPEALREMSDLNISPDSCHSIKTLGIHWLDCLYAATPDVSNHSPATKRRVASVFARIFDPLGWFSPATLPAKTMLKDCW